MSTLQRERDEGVKRALLTQYELHKTLAMRKQITEQEERRKGLAYFASLAGTAVLMRAGLRRKKRLLAFLAWLAWRKRRRRRAHLRLMETLFYEKAAQERKHKKLLESAPPQIKPIPPFRRH